MNEEKNPLEYEKIPKLLMEYCVPALASGLVTCLYNIVDQLFIGNVLGVVGNASTNVVYPIVTFVTALTLMCGVGPSNAMNLNRGKGNFEEAGRCVGGGIGMMILCGFACMIPMLLWTQPLLRLFGCTDTVMPYAEVYGRIIALSFVFTMIGSSGIFLIRADGATKYSLAVAATGTFANIVLDALFIYKFDWGLAGAAWATFIAQVISTVMVIWYLVHSFSSFPLKREYFRPDFKRYKDMALLGIGPAFNFGTQALVMVFLNNALRIYGAQSVYGSDVCLAVAGIANKVNTFANAVVTGMTNGMQPINAYNFGKKNYKRVAQTSKTTICIVLLIGVGILVIYQLFAVPITALFGDGSEEYFAFAKDFFCIFYLLIPLYGLQSSVAGFFTSQGKVKRAVFISLVRQVLFFPPLLIILPRFMGLDGVLWSGPVSDLAMAVTASVLFVKEIKQLESM